MTALIWEDDDGEIFTAKHSKEMNKLIPCYGVFIAALGAFWMLAPNNERTLTFALSILSIVAVLLLHSNKCDTLSILIAYGASAVGVTILMLLSVYNKVLVFKPTSQKYVVPTWLPCGAGLLALAVILVHRTGTCFTGICRSRCMAFDKFLLS